MIGIVDIPATINSKITPNHRPLSRGGQMHKYSLQKELKDTTITASRSAGLHLGDTPEGPLLLKVTVAWGKHRKRMDDDNLVASLKYVQDGIAHVLKVDDKHMTIDRPVTQIRSTDGNGYITVEIEEAS